MFSVCSILRPRTPTAAKILPKLVLAALSAGFLIGSMDAAEARRRHHGYKRHVIHTHAGGRYSPPYAEIVYDVNTGKVLTAINPDSPRHPASITKVMTLYLLFEQLERGKIALDTELEVSAHAASQAPSKLGLRPGATIEVEDAIKAIVTKSANDVAATIGENIAGSESAFAEQMTRKARAIGMRNTHFRNASGLPDEQQVTTARDLALLGRAIQDRFPKYYRYFSTRSFAFRGRSIGNHNRLLGRVEGVDGIKTGYTRASGFNLLTSARIDGHHIITVVLGGRSGRERDNKVAALLDEHLATSSTSRRTTQFAEAEVDEAPVPVISTQVVSAPAVSAPVVPQRRESVATLATAPVSSIPTAGAAKPADRPKPAVVAELTRDLPTARTEPAKEAGVKVGALPTASRPNITGGTTARVGAVPSVMAGVTPSGPALRWNKGSQPKAVVDADVRAGQPTDPSIRKALGLKAEADIDRDTAITTATVQPKPFAGLKDATADQAVARPVTAPKVEAVAAEATPRSGWVIQLAATDDEAKARAILAEAKARNKSLLGDARSFTERVQKGSATMYRARFAGFDGREAEVACRSLKRAGYACFAQHI